MDQITNDYFSMYKKDIDINKDNDFYLANASVPLAANITSIAQVIENSWKYYIDQLGGKIYYGDTDSIVTNIQLPKETLGKGLGFMYATAVRRRRDELEGGIIKEGFFFIAVRRNKQYAFNIENSLDWLKSNLRNL